MNPENTSPAKTSSIYPRALPDIHLVGAGAIGLLFASKLSTVANVHLISRSGKTIDQDCIITDTLNHSESYRFKKSPDEVAPIRWLFVCTKSYDVKAAIQGLSSRLTPDTTIVVFANGMGYQEIISANHPDNKLIIASTTEGANRISTTQVRHAGKGVTIIGLFNAPEKAPQSFSVNTKSMNAQSDLNSLKSWLTAAGFSCTATEHIRTTLWKKLIVNCGINPFTALLNCPNGEILAAPFFQSRIGKLSKELSLAAKIQGVNITANECLTSITTVARSTETNISSMLQDVRQQRRTEIAFINGFIDQLGEKYGAQFPINKELVTLIEKLSASGKITLEP